jgi:hypothetical protein
MERTLRRYIAYEQGLVKLLRDFVIERFGVWGDKQKPFINVGLEKEFGQLRIPAKMIGCSGVCRSPIPAMPISYPDKQERAALVMTT